MYMYLFPSMTTSMHLPTCALKVPLASYYIALGLLSEPYYNDSFHDLGHRPASLRSPQDLALQIHTPPPPLILDDGVFFCFCFFLPAPRISLGDGASELLTYSSGKTRAIARKARDIISQVVAKANHGQAILEHIAHSLITYLCVLSGVAELKMAFACKPNRRAVYRKRLDRLPAYEEGNTDDYLNSSNTTEQLRKL